MMICGCGHGEEHHGVSTSGLVHCNEALGCHCKGFWRPKVEWPLSCILIPMFLAMWIVLVVLMIIFYCSKAHAEEIPTEKAVHAIMGEARGESFEGKLAVAEALRRRGTLSGVYGVRVPLHKLRQEKQTTWEEAHLAWEKSKSSRVVPKADHWFSEDDIKKLSSKPPKWFRKLTRVKKVGGHTFYAA